jgi:hypothetical protein
VPLEDGGGANWASGYYHEDLDHGAVKPDRLSVAAMHEEKLGSE